MKKIIIFINIFLFSTLSAEQNIKFYLGKAVVNNLQLNAERKNLESAKQNRNISRSEFLPNITISGDQTSSTSTNQTNREGESIVDSNLDTEKRTISVEQKYFLDLKE